MAKAAKSAAFPKTFGACADLLYQVKNERLAAQKVVDALAARESEIKNYIIDNLPKSEGGAIGKTAKITLVPKSQFQVKDWDKFYEYIRKNKAYDLLQRRPSEAAIGERADAGKPIPGIERFNYTSISLNKV